MDLTPATAPNTTRVQPAAEPPKAESALSSDFETFLRMLTTQMQNQDPLNPMASTEFATQLATFSSVEQQTKTNELLTSMAAQLGVMGLSQVTGWVGMQGRTSGPVWVDDSEVAFRPEPATGADRMAIVVRTEDGRQVGRYETPASDEALSWLPTGPSGAPLPAGAYTFELESLRGGEVMSSDPLETYAEIVEVRTVEGETRLILEGGISAAPADVTALRKPETPEHEAPVEPI